MEIIKANQYNQGIGKYKLLSSNAGVGSVVATKWGGFIMPQSSSLWPLVDAVSKYIERNGHSSLDLKRLSEETGVEVVEDNRFVSFLKKTQRLEKLKCLVALPHVSLTQSNQIDIKSHPLNLRYIDLHPASSGLKPELFAIPAIVFPRWFYSRQYDFKPLEEWLDIWRRLGCNVDKNTLRFENVYNRVMLKKLGINTLSDLLSVEKQKVLSDDMKETLKYILIIEKAPIKNMYSDEDYKYLMTRKTKKYWTDLIKNDPANFARERKKYDSISLYSKSIKSAIKNKINLTTSEVLVKVELSSKQQENRDINTCDTDICKVTGYKIMHVKKRRCFLGAKCVEYYHKNNKEIFEKLKNAFLVKEKYYNTNIKEQYKDIAHNIRNRHHNKFRYIVRAGVNQIPLF